MGGKSLDQKVFISPRIETGVNKDEEIDMYTGLY